MPKEQSKFKKIGIIRSVYLYLVAAITIIMILVSTVGLVRLVLEEYVFDVQGYEQINVKFECSQEQIERENPDVDDDEIEQLIAECEEDAEERAELQHSNNVKRDFINWISMLIVAIPLYWYHWRLIQKEGDK